MWAVGDVGTVLHATSNGSAPVVWTVVDVGLTSNLTAVSESADGAVFVASQLGEVVRGDATAGDWAPLPALIRDGVTGLWAASRDEVWAACAESTVHHWTTAAGWTATSVAPDVVTAVVGRGTNDVWMASSMGHALHWDGTAFSVSDMAAPAGTTARDFPLWHMGQLADGTLWSAGTSGSDGDSWILSGGAWSPTSSYTMAGDSLTDYWAAGYEGTAIHLSPAGPDAVDATFLGSDPTLAGRSSDLWAISGRSARHGNPQGWDAITSLFQETDGVHVAPTGDVWLTGLAGPSFQPEAARWDGSRWSLFQMPSQAQSPTVASNGTDVWLARTSLWRWSAGALVELPFPTAPPFPAAGWFARQLFAVPGAVWIFGTDSGGDVPALLWTDGKTWRDIPLPEGYAGDPVLTGLGGTSDSDLWLIYDGMFVAHYDGRAWAERVALPGSGRYPIRDLWALGPDDVWVGSFHFDGTTWKATAPIDGLAEIYATWAAADDDVWALSGTGLHHFDGTAWSGPLALPNGDFWSGLSAISSGDLWLVGTDGIVHGAPSLAASSR